MPRKRRICFVTGTRAEFGLMESALRAIRSHPRLELQIVATGMHTQSRYGKTVDELRRAGWSIDRTIQWRDAPSGPSPQAVAASTGRAIASLASAFDELDPDVVLVVGDRVEAFATAAAGHLSQRVVAHVHGGDRAMGQVDDSLRHAISKLAHVHFPATAGSAERLRKLGEDAWRIHLVGTPGVDGIHDLAAPAAELGGVAPNRFALLVLHPVDADEALEYKRAKQVLSAATSTGLDRIVIVYPNNDPGSAGIIRCWEEHARDARVQLHRNLPRARFLGLLRDAAVLAGNSSSGIIEAASFGTPVVDVGPRQQGRERSENVTNVPYGQAPVRRAMAAVWNDGRPKRRKVRNVYGGGDAGRRIAQVLSKIRLDDRRLRKLISY